MLAVWTRSDILMLRFMIMNALIESGGRVRRLAWTSSVAYSIVMSAAASPALQPTTGLTHRCLASSWSSHPSAWRAVAEVISLASGRICFGSKQCFTLTSRLDVPAPGNGGAAKCGPPVASCRRLSEGCRLSCRIFHEAAFVLRCHLEFAMLRPPDNILCIHIRP